MDRLTFLIPWQYAFGIGSEKPFRTEIATDGEQSVGFRQCVPGRRKRVRGTAGRQKVDHCRAVTRLWCRVVTRSGDGIVWFFL